MFAQFTSSLTLYVAATIFYLDLSLTFIALHSKGLCEVNCFVSVVYFMRRDHFLNRTWVEIYYHNVKFIVTEYIYIKSDKNISFFFFQFYCPHLLSYFTVDINLMSLNFSLHHFYLPSYCCIVNSLRFLLFCSSFTNFGLWLIAYFYVPVYA